jgi:hypothetical protein
MSRFGKERLTSTEPTSRHLGSPWHLPLWRTSAFWMRINSRETRTVLHRVARSGTTCPKRPGEPERRKLGAPLGRAGVRSAAGSRPSRSLRRPKERDATGRHLSRAQSGTLTHSRKDEHRPGSTKPVALGHFGHPGGQSCAPGHITSPSGLVHDRRKQALHRCLSGATRAILQRSYCLGEHNRQGGATIALPDGAGQCFERVE